MICGCGVWGQGYTFPVKEVFLEELLESSPLRIKAEASGGGGGGKKRVVEARDKDRITQLYEVGRGWGWGWGVRWDCRGWRRDRGAFLCRVSTSTDTSPTSPPPLAPPSPTGLLTSST